MTESTIDQQRIAAAAASATVKLEGFRASLSPDEQLVIGAALSKAVAQAAAPADDVAGYRTALDIALDSVANLPIWGPLQDAVNALTRPIDFSKGFDGTPPYSPR